MIEETGEHLPAFSRFLINYEVGINNPVLSDLDSLLVHLEGLLVGFDHELKDV